MRFDNSRLLPAASTTASRTSASRTSASRTTRRGARLGLATVEPDWDLIQLNGAALGTPRHRRPTPAGSISAVSYRAELRPSSREVLSHLLDRNSSLVARTRLTGGRAAEDFEATGEKDSAWSMDSAIAAAASLLGRPVREAGLGAIIEAVRDDTSGLRCEDVICTVEGKAVDTASALKRALAGRISARVQVTRGPNRQTEAVTLRRHNDGTWGVRVLTAGRVLEHDLHAGFTLPEDLRGPSLGLACALSVVDAFTDGQLGANGDVVATGTVDLSGRVGGVGAMVYKARAVRANPQVRRFLVPAEPASDVADARRVLAGRAKVVAVSTLAEAVNVLRKLS